jgi:hypothetical protein
MRLEADMRQIFWAVLAGLLFGAGLAVSQMANPAKVLAFLDVGAIPSGGWDPSLALVMVGALIVTFFGFAIARRRERPLAADRFEWPTRRDIDARLVAGSVLFGVGWGLVGYCPGPAIASLAWGRSETIVFVLAMIAGMVIWRRTLGTRTGAPVSAR